MEEHKGQHQGDHHAELVDGHHLRGPAKLQGAIFTLDSATGLCTAVERVDIR